MTWSDKTKAALRSWLAPSTWHKGGPFEDSRFYVFVASVWNDEHGIWDEAATREIITREAMNLHPSSGDLAERVAKDRVDEGTTILDFLLHLREAKRFELLSP